MNRPSPLPLPLPLPNPTINQKQQLNITTPCGISS